MLISPRKLAAAGILGMNSRNHDFIGRYNSRHLYPLVDDKLKTKRLAEKYGIATPKLRFVLHHQYEVKRTARLLAQRESFVVKPAKGSGGKGILVIVGRNGDRFVKGSGVEVTLHDVERHMSNIIAGLHSLGGNPDSILIEDVVQCAPWLAAYSYEGVPDIRVIVFKGYPILAMVRLATHASDGKANLHQGAVGVGIDIATGCALKAVQQSRRIRSHPDNDADLHALQIQDWTHLLEIASGCAEMTGLGYLGADLVIDREHGPELLELNARPGLAIQIANGIGLVPRLRHIEALDTVHQDAATRVAYVQRAFAVGTVLEGAEAMSPG